MPQGGGLEIGGLNLSNLPPLSGGSLGSGGRGFLVEAQQMAEQESILQEDGWAVIDAFFEEKGLAHQQLGSFNDFMSVQMQKASDNHPIIEIVPQPTFESSKVVILIFT